jgi:hypothetical protein
MMGEVASADDDAGLRIELVRRTAGGTAVALALRETGGDSIAGSWLVDETVRRALLRTGVGAKSSVSSTK